MGYLLIVVHKACMHGIAHCDVLKCDCDLIMYRGVKAVLNDVQGQFDYVKGGKSSNLIMDRGV